MIESSSIIFFFSFKRYHEDIDVNYFYIYISRIRIESRFFPFLFQVSSFVRAMTTCCVLACTRLQISNEAYFRYVTRNLSLSCVCVCVRTGLNCND